MAQEEDKSKELGYELKFTPPLYKQRYAVVVDLARKHKPQKVVDIGCAECKLLSVLKRELYMEKLVGVDIMPLHKHVGTLRPLIHDYLHRRATPLQITLMNGSIAQPDPKLKDFDLLTCVEVIEHLDYSVLKATPPAIFGFLRPRMVIMTTPNAEFNVLFRGFKQFRHPDHRFEWSRLQFQDWCHAAAQQFGYSVEFGGIGDPPKSREDVGHCTQMAVFSLKTDASLSEMPTVDSAEYTTVADIEYPYKADNMTLQEKLRHECEYYLHSLRKSCEEEEDGNSDQDCVKIALDKLLIFPRIKTLAQRGLADIRDALTESVIAIDDTGECAILPYEEVFSSEDEESSVEERTDYHEPAVSNCCHDNAMATECWD